MDAEKRRDLFGHTVLCPNRKTNSSLRLLSLGFQGFLIMICVGIYAVLVNNMVIADNLHTAIFSIAAYTVLLCFNLLKSGALAKSLFHAH